MPPSGSTAAMWMQRRGCDGLCGMHALCGIVHHRKEDADGHGRMHAQWQSAAHACALTEQRACPKVPMAELPVQFA
jgi:hypothetical protein